MLKNNKKSLNNVLITLVQSHDIYLRVIKYIRSYILIFLLALLCMTIYGASDGVIPFLVKYVLEEVFRSKSESYLYAFPLILLGLSTVRSIADFGQQYLVSQIGHLVVRDLRQEMTDKVLRLSPRYFLHHSSGDIITRSTSDVLMVRSLITDSIASLIRDVIRIIVLFGSAIYLDPFLAAIAFIGVPLGVIPVYKFGKRLRRLSRIGQDGVGSLGARMQEFVAGSKIVQIFMAEEYESERFKNENEKLTQTLLKSERFRAAIGPINEILASIAICGVILYGGFSVFHESRTQGDFIAFLMAVFLMYDPFKKLSRVSSQIQIGVAGASRVFELIDEVPQIENNRATLALATKNSISFKSVHYRYPNSIQDALDGIDLSVDEGEKIAIVGFSGSGKSTLVDLIPRFLDPNDGLVEIGGTNIKYAELKDVRNRITMVTQHTFLFNDTIFNNILYGNRNATEEMVYEAASKAFAFEFIEKLPKGFNSVVGEGGFSLSGGERQRIAIARALLKDSPILILDEATASLDTKAERMVQQAIEELEKNRTSLVIAHRLSTIQNSDRIVVMSNGKIVETGTHQSLLSDNGEYQKLYSLQFS
jgi:ATP-binding cassette, subfamily B, bacterial MsbA